MPIHEEMNVIVRYQCCQSGVKKNLLPGELSIS